MNGRSHPPHLRLVGTVGSESDRVDLASPYPLVDSLKIAVAPLEDAARFMTAAAVQAVEDGALDFGFAAGDLDPLRAEVQAVMLRFSLGWIAERLAEYREHDGNNDDVPGR